jgi:D-glycero-D-manno-heptose 1,7-bisphosphate phosphatase
MSDVKQAVILAGGRGTRLRPLTDSLPKPMIDVNGEPFIAHLLRLVANQGLSDVLILTGYLGNQIEEFFGDSFCGLNISYSREADSFSSGERILAAKKNLDDSFLLLYADNYALFELNSLLGTKGSSDATMVLSVCSKKPGNIVLGKDSLVSDYLLDRSEGSGEFVEVGFSLVDKERFVNSLDNSAGSLPTAIESLAKQGRVLAHIIGHPYFSVSDPRRLELTRTALSRRPVLLIDRDGVLNIKAPRGEYITRYEDFSKIEANWKALQKLGLLGFTFIVISNQAGVARGVMSQSAVDEIHSFMRRDFRDIGVEIADIYVCPHHWDEGCECRKPNPGMFFTAACDHNLLLNDLIYVGDDVRDESAAIAAGCTPLIVGVEARNQVNESTATFMDLSEALEFILLHYRSNLG